MINIEFRESARTLKLHKGQVVGLFGKNGSGKTTLLKQIMGVTPYAKYLIKHEVDGKSFSHKSLSNMIYITDGQCLYEDMTAKEHKEFYKDFYINFNDERFNKLMEFFELESDNLVKNFSKGQRSKLELVLGFSVGAKYIMMDEPFLGNDPFARNAFLKIMAGFIDEDSILVIATHYLEEIENFIDRAIFMDEYKIVKDISMDEIADSGVHLIDIAKEIFGVENNKVMSLFLDDN